MKNDQKASKVESKEQTMSDFLEELREKIDSIYLGKINISTIVSKDHYKVTIEPVHKNLSGNQLMYSTFTYLINKEDEIDREKIKRDVAELASSAVFLKQPGNKIKDNPLNANELLKE